MPSGGKVHKSLRVEADTAERVRSLMRDGESEAAAYNRVLVAGLDAMEGTAGRDPTETGGTAADDGEQAGPGRDGTGWTGSGEAMRAVSDSLAALTGQLSVMASQLEAKDEQIRALTELAGQSQTIAKQAQALHAVTEAKALPVEADDGAGQGRRRGWFSRHFGRR